MSNIISPSTLLVLLLLVCGFAVLAIVGPQLYQVANGINIPAAPEPVDPYLALINDMELDLASTAPVVPPIAPPENAQPPLTREQLARLPLTNHAKASAIGRNWNGITIREQILADKCSPIEVYWCTDCILVTCGPHQGTDLGLVMGTLTPNWPIVTGYPSNNWQRKIGECIGPFPLP